MFKIRIKACRTMLLVILPIISVTVTACTHAAPRNSVRSADIRNLVAREAVNLGISVPLALAVAHTESDFDPRAESIKGARGVMQIMPATAWGEYGIEPDLLWDPRINVRIGLHFLGRLLDRYHGRVDLALSYYNGGSRVGTLPHARVIPATRSYVARVKKLRAYYRRRPLIFTQSILKGDSHVL